MQKRLIQKHLIKNTKIQKIYTKIYKTSYTKNLQKHYTKKPYTKIYIQNTL